MRERVGKAFGALGRSPPSDLHVPLYRSHVADLAVAPDGSLWALTQRGDTSAAVIDRFAADGEFSGSYLVRLRVGAIAVSSSAIYFLARSSLDVPGIAVAPKPETPRREEDR